MAPILRGGRNVGHCEERKILRSVNVEKPKKHQEVPDTTTPSSPTKIQKRPRDEPKYCHCEKKSHGSMVKCDNDICPMVWFHFKCVQITAKPKGKWYCFDCRDCRHNRMKSRAEVMQQLIDYNKRKENEYMRQFGDN